MNKRVIIFFAMMLIPFVCGAAEASKEKRGILSGIAHLEGRGFSNLLLFPAEWGHLPKAEYGGALGVLPVALSHAATRIFTGVADIVWLPIMYPFAKYDESVPVNMGWGEYPWQKPSNS